MLIGVVSRIKTNITKSMKVFTKSTNKAKSTRTSKGCSVLKI